MTGAEWSEAECISLCYQNTHMQADTDSRFNDCATELSSVNLPGVVVVKMKDEG